MAIFNGKNNGANKNNSASSEVETKENSKLILIKGKVAEKGLKSFLRCGVKFTDSFQELEVDEATLKRLKQEKKLTIQEIK